METVGAVTLAVGPIVAVLLVLWRFFQKTMFKWERRPLSPPAALPPPPPRPDQLAGDRVPRRPLQPSLTGAAALPIPQSQDEDEPAPPPEIALPRSGDPGTFGVAS